PIAQRYGVDLTHLGIIFLTNLEIGYSTPPVGLNHAFKNEVEQNNSMAGSKNNFLVINKDSLGKQFS
ncbi:MAG: TRAP transporter large permease subunit, partial [Ignavibacteriaceae bacterium]